MFIHDLYRTAPRTGPGQRSILNDKNRTYPQGCARLVWNSLTQGTKRVRDRHRGTPPKANAIRQRRQSKV